MLAQKGCTGVLMTQRTRYVVIAGLTLAAIVGIFLLPPIPQSQDYHAFADNRTLFGVPNFLDVVSSAAFIAAGTAGLIALYRPRPDGRGRFCRPSDRWPYGVLFLGVGLVGLGSAYYHLAPDNARLVWDRMPMALAFAALLSAVVTERADGSMGVVLLILLALVGVGSVLYWHITEVAGRGDLRPYALVQYYPMLAVPVMMYLFPSRYTRGGDLLGAAILYAVAKGCEALDAAVFSLGHFVSGHTLKHLSAATATILIIRMLRQRRPVSAREKIFGAVVP
jgi:hypothetical protein